MASLVSPDKAGTMSAESLEHLEAELSVQAAKLDQSLHVGDRSPGNGRVKPMDQQIFDGQIGSNHDPLGSEHLTQDDVAYLQKMGVDLARIERAARGSGISMPPAPMDAATHAINHEAGIATDAKPENYSFDLGRLNLDLPPDRQAAVQSTLQIWSSELRLDPNLARGIGAFIISESPRLAQFNTSQLASWVSQQKASLLKSCGNDKAAVTAITEKAHKVLSMSGVINGTEKFSEAVRNSQVGQSAWLLTTLANHFDAMSAADRAKARL